MIRITAPHFCAGVVVEGGFVIQAAPILHYMSGWTVGHVINYCKAKRWSFERL